MSKKEMINSTSAVKGEGVLESTLKAYDEFDMNVLNDPNEKISKYQPKSNK